MSVNPRITKLYEETVIPEQHPAFRQCHASTVLPLPDGDALVAYFAGEKEGAPDCSIWMSRREQGRWGEPYLVERDPEMPLWNPVLFRTDATLSVFYKRGGSVQDWTTRVANSADFGRTWERSRELVQGAVLPRGPIRNKPVMLSDGSWLAGGSIERGTEWDAFADRSQDSGATWDFHPVPFAHRETPAAERQGELWEGLKGDDLWESDPNVVFAWDGIIQPTVWESEPGSVHMMLRSTRGRIYRSDSLDYGENWCAAYETDLPNNNSGIDVVRLATGELVLAFNPVGGNWAKRTPLSVAVSTDNGHSWGPRTDVATGEGEFSYPAITADGGDVLLTYTRDRRNIVYTRLSLEG